MEYPLRVTPSTRKLFFIFTSNFIIFDDVFFFKYILYSLQVFYPQGDLFGGGGIVVSKAQKLIICKISITFQTLDRFLIFSCHWIVIANIYNFVSDGNPLRWTFLEYSYPKTYKSCFQKNFFPAKHDKKFGMNFYVKAWNS